MRKTNTRVLRPPLAGIVRSAVGHRVTTGGEPRAIRYDRFGGNSYDSAHDANERAVERGIIVSGLDRRWLKGITRDSK